MVFSQNYTFTGTRGVQLLHSMKVAGDLFIHILYAQVFRHSEMETVRYMVSTKKSPVQINFDEFFYGEFGARVIDTFQLNARLAIAYAGDLGLKRHIKYTCLYGSPCTTYKSSGS